MHWFSEQGWQVDYVSAGEEEVLDCYKQYSITIARSPFNLKNIKAYKELREILKNNYDIIHCHTPVGGGLARLVARKICTKIIYTAHGFHFYEGAPPLNWLIYYPFEKFLSRYTDCLITINQEDYMIARNRFKIRGGQNIYRIDGVGVDLLRFYKRTMKEKLELRESLGYSVQDFIVVNVAEINKNKNQLMLIKVLPKLKSYIPNIKVLLVGKDNYKPVKVLAYKLNLQACVEFLGYRDDVDDLLSISDIAFSASCREGLPINILEAMASGIPIVCSRNRGHNALIKHNESGLLFLRNNTEEMIQYIVSIYNSPELAVKLSATALKNVAKYNVDIILSKMITIYQNFMPSQQQKV
jgi:glycosyltransferase EpsD